MHFFLVWSVICENFAIQFPQVQEFPIYSIRLSSDTPVCRLISYILLFFIEKYQENCHSTTIDSLILQIHKKNSRHLS